jgi:Flp pilus assembly protein TadG
MTRVSDQLARFKRLIADRRGASAVFIGLMAPVLVGAGGLAADVGFWLRERAKVQRAADASALAAAQAIGTGVTNLTALQPYVDSTGRLNNVIYGTRLVRRSNDNKSVEVEVTTTVQPYFARVFTSAPLTVRAVATATVGRNLFPICLFALELDPYSDFGIRIINNGQVRADDCAAHSNATNNQSNAWSEDGSIFVRNGRLEAALVSASGSIVASTNGVSVITPAPDPNMPRLPLPFTISVAPATGACAPSTYNWGNHTLQPGNYCNGLTLQNGANVGLNAGVYVISGNFTVTGGAKIRNSDDVTIFVVNGLVNWSNDSDVTIKSPRTGPYAGILLHQGGNPPGGCNMGNRFTGQGNNAHYRLGGAVVFDGCPLTVENNAKVRTPGNDFTFLAARFFEFTGSADVRINWDSPYGIAGSMSSGQIPSTLRPPLNPSEL